MRTIVLFEADFNFTNKVIGKKISAAAERNGGFAPEQYGSRKGHRAIEHALNKVLTLDLLRFQKRPGALCTNDLNSCYDRIVHSVASLCLQRQGLAESEVVCMFSTLQNLRHTIRTAFGDSETSYGGDGWVVPLQGIYQGNGAGPLIWAVVSSPLLEILRAEGCGTFFKACLDKEEIRLAGYAFVDDTDLIQTGRGNETAAEVAQEMQRGLSLWEGLVNATGGALVVEDKSTWWLLDFTWHEDGSWSYTPIPDAPAELWATDIDGRRKALSRREAHSAFETLGVHLAPDGQQQTAFTELKAKAELWASGIKKARLSFEDAWYAWQSTILRSLEYPLAALSLTESQCDRLMAIVKSVALPKSGLVRSFPKHVLHAPLSHLGLDIPNLYTTQIGAHLQIMVQHGERDTLTGQLLRGSIQALTLEVGIRGQVLRQDYSIWGHLCTNSWIKAVWKEISDHPSLSLLAPTTGLHLQRTNDRYLMEEFHHHGFKGKALLRLNRCRSFLHAITLADICTGDGRMVLLPCWNGTNAGCLSRRQDHDWPVQGPLPDRDWELWRRALRKIGCGMHTRILTLRLGPWINKPIHHWDAAYDPTSGHLWLQKSSTWHQYRQEWGGFGTITNFHPLNHQTGDAPPDTAKRAVAWHDNNHVEFFGCALDHPPPVPPSDYPWYRAHSSHENALDLLAQYLQNHPVIALTDGSFKLAKGTAAFNFYVPFLQQSISFAHATPGSTEDQCPYRSELTGIYGILRVLHDVHISYPDLSGHIIIGCDCQGAGYRALTLQSFPSTGTQHADIVRAIWHLRQALPFTFAYHYVEGHQRERGRDMDYWGSLNEDMDALAKAYWSHIQHRPLPQHPLHKNEWAVFLDQERVAHNIPKRIRRHLHCLFLQNWFNQKTSNSIPAPQWQTIDYDAIAQANKACSTTEHLWRCKFAAHMCPTGLNMVRRKHWTSDRCPICKTSPESHLHLLQCQHHHAITERRRLFDKMIQQLLLWNTCPVIIHLLSTTGKQWLLGDPIEPNEEYHDGLVILQAQLSLGWQRFWEGRIVKEWGEQQLKYLQEHSPKYCIQRHQKWRMLFVTAIFTCTFGIWSFRNKILHESDEIPNTISLHLQLDGEIRRLWAEGPDQMTDMDRIQFHGGLSLTTLLGKRLDFKSSWVAYVKAARKAWREQHEWQRALEGDEWDSDTDT